MFKQSLNDLDTKTYPYSLSVKVITNYPKRTMRANGIIYHIFKPNNFRDVLFIYQDKSSMDMTLNELKFLTSTCRNRKYQPLPIDKTKNKNTGRYRLGLNSIFVFDSSLFQSIN